MTRSWENLHHHIMLVNLYSPCRNASLQKTETEWWQNRSNNCVLSENVHVLTHARFSYSRYFKCHVFSVCQNSRCDARYVSDHEKPGYKSSQKCKFWTPTHQLHSSLSFCRSYTEVCISVCHVQTTVTLFSMAVPNTLSTDFRKFKTMLRASSWRFLKLTILHHTYKLYTGFQ